MTFVLLGAFGMCSKLCGYHVQRTVWLQPPLLPTALGEDLFVSGVLGFVPALPLEWFPSSFSPRSRWGSECPGSVLPWPEAPAWLSSRCHCPWQGVEQSEI